jgi:hypothetical protein
VLKSTYGKIDRVYRVRKGVDYFREHSCEDVLIYANPFDFDNIKIGQDWQALKRNFIGYKIENVPGRLSNDPEISEELRSIYKRTESKYQEEVKGISQYGVIGDVNLYYGDNYILESASIYFWDLIPNGDYMREQKLPISTVNKIINYYSKKYGMAKEEIDGYDHNWQWLKDGIKTTVGADIYDEPSGKRLDNFHIGINRWSLPTLELE